MNYRGKQSTMNEISRTGEHEHEPVYRGPTGRFGLHLTLDGYHGAPERLADPLVVRAWLDELPEVLGMHKLIQPCLVEVGALNDKDPGGVTGFVLIAQSHLSVHTFPRRRFVSADIFTCQDDLDQESIRRSLIATFGLGDVESNLMERGTRYPLVNLDDPPK
jgi:S-adenosylmethionine decarboxylase